MLPGILEVAMLVCFGCSWPMNLIKSVKTRSTKGKSLLFLILIDVGYVAGMGAKLSDPSFVWAAKWWVFAIYVLNFLMVSADLILYFINRSREKKEARPA